MSEERPKDKSILQKIVENTVQFVQIMLMILLLWCLVSSADRVVVNLSKKSPSWDSNSLGGSLKVTLILALVLFVLAVSSFNLWKKLA